MAIRVEHQPTPAGWGMAAYLTGRGRARKEQQKQTLDWWQQESQQARQDEREAGRLYYQNAMAWQRQLQQQEAQKAIQGRFEAGLKVTQAGQAATARRAEAGQARMGRQAQGASYMQTARSWPDAATRPILVKLASEIDRAYNDPKVNWDDPKQVQPINAKKAELDNLLNTLDPEKGLKDKRQYEEAQEQNKAKQADAAKAALKQQEEARERWKSISDAAGKLVNESRNPVTGKPTLDYEEAVKESIKRQKIVDEAMGIGAQGQPAAAPAGAAPAGMTPPAGLTQENWNALNRAAEARRKETPQPAVATDAAAGNLPGLPPPVKNFPIGGSMPTTIPPAPEAKPAAKAPPAVPPGAPPTDAAQPARLVEPRVTEFPLQQAAAATPPSQTVEPITPENVDRTKRASRIVQTQMRGLLRGRDPSRLSDAEYARYQALSNQNTTLRSSLDAYDKQRSDTPLRAATRENNLRYRQAMDRMRKKEFPSDEQWDSMDAKTKAKHRRRYSDEILHGRGQVQEPDQPEAAAAPAAGAQPVASVRDRAIAAARSGDPNARKALDERGIQWREF